MRILGKAALAAVGLSIASATSFAADLPMMKAPAQTYMAPALPSWTGIYVGVHAGYGGGETNYPFVLGPIAGSANLQSSGGFAGGQIGYNWQIGSAWVVGVEADIAWSGIEDHISFAIGPLNLTAGTELDYFGTVRGRIGYLLTPSALVYATGGWAYGRTTSSLTVAGLIGAGVSTEQSKSGWALGGGLEYALNDWISFKTEYLYVDLGEDVIASGAGLGLAASLSEDTRFHTVKAGLNFRFNAF